LLIKEVAHIKKNRVAHYLAFMNITFLTKFNFYLFCYYKIFAK